MHTKITKGENKQIEPQWYHLLLIITVIPAWILLAIATVIIFIADILLMDTHHTTFKLEPKWKK